MKFVLMHRNRTVAAVKIDEITGVIYAIGEIYDSGHLPLGTNVKDGSIDRAKLNDWWRERCIPNTRQGIRSFLEEFQCATVTELLVKSYALSLTDLYWICPEREKLSWEGVNFFANAFSEDIGEVLFGKEKESENISFDSPDLTTDGCLKKRWKIINGKRCLIKGGSNPYRQQTFNEVIATKIMARLGIEHVPYSILWENGEPYSVCGDFVTADTELISAWRIMQTQKKDNSKSVYRHFVDCCQTLGAPDVVPALDKMIVLDYLIANEDRHLNNFGLLRNAETLEWLGFAPVFDSGSSLGYDKLNAEIRANKNITCKPFKKRHEEQLKLVSDFGWIKTNCLADLGKIVEEVFSDARVAEFIDESRVQAITESVQRRVAYLEEFINAQVPAEDSTEGDVEENIAEDYLPKM